MSNTYGVSLHSPIHGVMQLDVEISEDTDAGVAAEKICTMLDGMFIVVNAQWVDVDCGDWKEKVLHVLFQDTDEGALLSGIANPLG